MTMTTLILVDCQKDFHSGGSLAIPTADEDAKRIAQFIRDHATGIDRILATLDSHQKLHIANPSFWVKPETGEHPPPFTIISSQDLKKKVWQPRPDLSFQGPLLDAMLHPSVFDGRPAFMKEQNSLDLEKYCIAYAERLEAKGGFQICVWPEHCLIGSTGHAMVDVIQEALYEWTEKTGRTVEWCWKGQNLLTEMYSALEAEVPVSPSTALNQELVDSLRQSSRVLVCGQAMSHCVNYTVRDLVQHWPSDKTSQVTILTDCASAVPGFEAAAETFLKDMKEKGVMLSTSGELT
eukprot:CAMPEP_0198136578 /NCGR_PEP_ID=MMETSP1443-20131203/220_1 /TAXON_ID=186043 /ORGANISM="Entomoneis sp., Strain CCMP2396" /LENGTH=292 /DNA_ID=CAMNT_0043797825 /DNA_START=74 /DNA_END=949 /DNA_ORIENTATION=-